MQNKNNTAIWKTYGIWAFWASVSFVLVYPTCNWLTAKRTSAYSLYTEPELAIPFIPGFFWVYMSLYLLFIVPPFYLGVSQLQRLGKQIITGTIFSGLTFLVFPAELGFERIAPSNEFYANIYSNLFYLDQPHNLVPSLHIIYSALIIFSVLDNINIYYKKVFWWGWLILMCLSTLLVHQHHLIDVLTGLLVALLLRKYYKKGGGYV